MTEKSGVDGGVNQVPTYLGQNRSKFVSEKKTDFFGNEVGTVVSKLSPKTLMIRCRMKALVYKKAKYY